VMGGSPAYKQQCCTPYQADLFGRG